MSKLDQGALARAGGADQCDFSLDTEGAAETPIPTPAELRSLREVVAPKRMFLQ